MFSPSRPVLLYLVLALVGLSQGSFRLCTPSVSFSAPSNDCNFPDHHSHLVIPLTSTLEQCQQPDAQFLLSHGATFFCPHVYDVKLRATFSDVNVQSLACSTFFNATASGHVSPTVVLRPTLPRNGLPASGLGITNTWNSPIMYHVKQFGTNAAAGPGDGWITDTLYNQTNITVNFEPIYFRSFDLATPSVSALTYLVYNSTNGNSFTGGNYTDNFALYLTHYITTAPNFDHITQVTGITMITDDNDTAALDPLIRNEWPLLLSFPGIDDTFDNRLPPYTQNMKAVLSTNDPMNNSTMSVTVMVETGASIYAGVSDGFAAFGENCEYTHPPAQQICVL
eukprot:TRINITY_DN9286_c0_g1_i1.p1 TRINITY_DN9286_c0_g1~~TRINITY_DN9286_c0_g1_i1.p1  ORF type:complete len:338 (+),score=40.63 TRINITY_DN9286_c0_g1_i1:107-1120(+)